MCFLKYASVYFTQLGEANYKVLSLLFPERSGQSVHSLH